MRYFYDCEFIEDGRTIEIVSIGVVDETAASSMRYRPSSTRPGHRLGTAQRSRQAARPVRPGVALAGPDPRRPARVLLAPGEPIELWAWMASYDHVVLAQLWGDMRALPRAIPRFTHELRQYWNRAGSPSCRRAAGSARCAGRCPAQSGRWRALRAD